MSVFLYFLLGVAGLALLSFVAGFLLSCPSLFLRSEMPRPRGLRLRPHPSDSTPPKPKEPAPKPAHTWSDYLLFPLWAPFAILLVIVIFPAYLAIALVAICQSYRYYRQLSYRALRRYHQKLAWPRSLVAGVQLLIDRRRRDLVSSATGNA